MTRPSVGVPILREQGAGALYSYWGMDYNVCYVYWNAMSICNGLYRVYKRWILTPGVCPSPEKSNGSGYAVPVAEREANPSAHCFVVISS